MYLLCMYVRMHMYRHIHGMCVEAREQFMGFGFHSPPSELQGSQVLRFCAITHWATEPAQILTLRPVYAM